MPMIMDTTAPAATATTAITVEELERLAIKGGTLPAELMQPEQLLFLQLRNLYRAFHANTITKEQGSAEKVAILAAYRQRVAAVASEDYVRAVRARLGEKVTYNDTEYTIVAVTCRISDGKVIFQAELKDAKANSVVIIKLDDVPPTVGGTKGEKI
jgi:hypothetical protein